MCFALYSRHVKPTQTDIKNPNLGKLFDRYFSIENYSIFAELLNIESKRCLKASFFKS